MYKIGSTKRDITHLIKGIGMFGYGMHFHKVQFVQDPIYVRSFVISDQNNTLFISNAELGAISFALKRIILQKLDGIIPIERNNFMLFATHTHSAPGGFFHYPLYNFSIPGYSEEMTNKYADIIAESIKKAYEQREDSDLEYIVDEFDPGVKLAFNRSIKAFMSNEEVRGETTPPLHEAIDPRMKMLRIHQKDGKRNSINWFGVHPTSVGNDHFGITGDNKGYAAKFMELEHQDSIHAFATGCCGDVSPNHTWSRKRNKMLGDSENDYESAESNGKKQFEKANDMISSSGQKVRSGIAYAHRFVNFSEIKITDEFSDGDSDARTSKPTMGVSFFEGTTDGVGISKGLGLIAKAISRFRRFRETAFSKKSKEKYNTQNPKDILLEAAEGKVFGIKNLSRLPTVDPMIGTLKQHFKTGDIKGKPFVPEILPIQIFKIGQIALVGLTCELTVHAGKRIEELVKRELKDLDVEHVIMVPYANGYSGYATTKEEYEVQCYEGGHTMYGKYTLQANLQECARLCRLMKGATNQVDLVDEYLFKDIELQKRKFESVNSV
ncbi:MAG: neutral/alkaline non-lysosomal ceramidase N-terminal domain-containing protein [Flavobacteriales bacterium]|nr:neutral/alkaline non-lysosomal ceramidase N-terminal domain-containing protein [Flavobacteriales bacterium]